jgi:hypothetical protein
MFSIPDPQAAIDTLFFESAVRAEQSDSMVKLILHWLTFPPALVFKSLPGTAFLLLPLVLYGWRKMMNKNPPEVVTSKAKMHPEFFRLLVILLVNLVPYMIAVGSRGRYVIPLFPIAAILTAYVLLAYPRRKMLRAFVYTAAGLVILRLLAAVFVIPAVMEHRDDSLKKIALQIIPDIKSFERVACDCHVHKAICMYVNLAGNTVVTKSSVMPDWEYNISCSDDIIEGATLLQSHKKKAPIHLYRRGEGE